MQAALTSFLEFLIFSLIQSVKFIVVFTFDNAKTKEKHIEQWDGSEESRLKAIRKVNVLIDEYNEENIHEHKGEMRLDLIKRHSRYKEWLLNSLLSDSVTRNPNNDNYLVVVTWDNEFLYKKGLQVNNQEIHTLSFITQMQACLSRNNVVNLACYERIVQSSLRGV